MELWHGRWADEAWEVLAAAFVQVDKIEKGMNVCAVLKAAFGETLFESGGGDVVPATFAQKIVPDFNFLFGGAPSMGEAPLKKLFVGAAGENLCAEIGVGDVEEVHATKVEALSEVGYIILREKILSVEPYFVQHASEVNKGQRLGVWAPYGGDLHFK